VKRRKFEFSVEVNEFAQGERVQHRGVERTVIGWFPPHHSGEDAVVWLEGVEYGVNAGSCDPLSPGTDGGSDGSDGSDGRGEI
jgi:hypothetical protein